jgi:Na+-translocating ferredoxin:NAD+ oxidoreductase subunit C
VHTGLAGVVREIAKRPGLTGALADCVIIDVDPEQEAVSWPEEDISNLSVDEIKARIKDAGIVGMGGAAFPTHVKLSPPREIDMMIVNGCECEPFLTCDHRLMVERAGDLVEGSRLISKMLGGPKVVFGLEINKQDAIDEISGKIATETNMEVVSLDVKYPQGSEKQLIYAVSKRMVPPGKLPFDVGVVVHNVATILAVLEAVRNGKPLTERVVTLTGPGAVGPGNYLVPIGTLISHIVESTGGLQEGVVKIVVGGPMTGWAQPNLDAPIVKGSGGILALTGDVTSVTEHKACVRCGKCVENCPMFLYPNYIGTYGELGRISEAEQWGAMDCFECGVCVFVCPSHRPIVSFVRNTKKAIAERHRAAARHTL